MAIKSSGPIGIEEDIIREFTHIENFAPHALTEYYGKNIIKQLTPSCAVGYTPAGKIPFGASDEALAMTKFYGVEIFYSILLDKNLNGGNFQELDLYQYAQGQGWNTISPLFVRLTNNTAIWSDDVGNPALLINNINVPLTLTVEGVIMGKGGRGGTATSQNYTAVINSGENNGQNGGTAISVDGDTDLTISVSGTHAFIAGGGGGGGGMQIEVNAGGSVFDQAEPRMGGGGGGSGGGNGGDASGRNLGTYAGGTGGAVDNLGGNGRAYSVGIPLGGSGGGQGGTRNERKARTDGMSSGGGGGRIMTNPSLYSSPGANGVNAGNGGGWGAAGGRGNASSGGSGGRAIAFTGSSLLISSGANKIYGAR